MIRKNLTIVVAAFAVLFASCEADKKTSTSAYGAMDLNVAKQSSLVNDLEIVEECLVSNDDGCLNLNIPSHNLWWPEKLHKSKPQTILAPQIGIPYYLLNIIMVLRDLLGLPKWAVV